MIMLSLSYNLITIIMKIRLLKIMKFLLEIAEHKIFPSFSIMLKLNKIAFNFDTHILNIKTIIVFLISHHLTHGGRNLETTNETSLTSNLVVIGISLRRANKIDRSTKIAINLRFHIFIRSNKYLIYIKYRRFIANRLGPHGRRRHLRRAGSQK